MTAGGVSLANVAIGGAAAAVVAFAALRVRALDRGGAIAAFAVGTATYGALGLPGSYVLLAFFISSVALSRVGKARKRAALVDVDKTGARDAAQVLANGGVAALCALAAAFVDARFAVAFAGSFAAAAADTWATEIGTLVKQPPRSILTLKPIATGLSGGITFAGTAAELVGAAFVALVALAVAAPHACAAVFAGGVAGAVADSLLGASLQALRWCPACDRATERDPHACGERDTSATRTRLVRQRRRQSVGDDRGRGDRDGRRGVMMPSPRQRNESQVVTSASSLKVASSHR